MILNVMLKSTFIITYKNFHIIESIGILNIYSIANIYVL